jgi:putative endonuclease
VKTYYVYILRCSDGTFYVGMTNNVELRVAQHNYGLSERSYTFSRRPVVCVYVSEYREVLEAIACEKKLKGWSHAKKDALVRGDCTQLRALSRRNRRPRTTPTEGA